MSRYCIYIDGFNVYYSLSNKQFRKYKWLNYRKLAESAVRSGDSIAAVYYFTTGKEKGVMPEWRLLKGSSIPMATARLTRSATLWVPSFRIMRLR